MSKRQPAGTGRRSLSRPAGLSESGCAQLDHRINPGKPNLTSPCPWDGRYGRAAAHPLNVFVTPCAQSPFAQRQPARGMAPQHLNGALYGATNLSA